MSSQISAPIRIVALVGVLMALAVGAWTFLAGQKSSGTPSSSAAAHAVGPVAQHPIAAAKAVASKLSAHNNATAAGKADSVAPAKPKPVTHPVVKPASAAPGAAPTTIASVLRHHRVAVVLVYDPQAKIDRFSLGETQLGAKRAHAGFLRVSVLEQRQVLPFAKTYGMLQVPTILFFARPGKVVQKLVGYADQDTVAQAALNAARGLVTTAG
jgi:thiol:disulfide interchange protein